MAQRFIFILTLFGLSSPAWPSFQSEKPAMESYCKEILNDSSRLTKDSKGYLVATPSYQQTLLKDPKLTSYYVLCLLVGRFELEFDQIQRPKFRYRVQNKEDRLKVLGYLFDRMGELVFSDTEEERKKAIENGAISLNSYYNSLVVRLVQKVNKKK